MAYRINIGMRLDEFGRSVCELVRNSHFCGGRNDVLDVDAEKETNFTDPIMLGYALDEFKGIFGSDMIYLW